MASGIYSITHVESGKRYIGQSVDVEDRLSHHRHQLRSGRHRNGKLARAVAKYGIDAFRFDVLVIVAPEMLTFYEQRLMDGFDAVRGGYNIAPAADSVRGTKRTPEQRANIAKAQALSRTRPEVIAALSAGIKASRQRPEVIRAISEGTKAAMNKPETRAKYMAAISQESYRAPRLARARSPDYRERVAEKVRAAYESTEVRERHRAACSTPEYRAKTAATNASPERKAQRAEAARVGWLKRKGLK